MENPLCKLCRERHSLRVPCRILSSPEGEPVKPFDLPTPKPLMSARELLGREEARKNRAIAPQSGTEERDWSDCPYCAARRAKRAATIRANREKKRG